MPDDPTDPLNSPVDETTAQLNMSGKVEFAPGANAGRFYANHIQANITLFEVRLLFNFVTGVNEATKNLVAQESLMISMSPELAEVAHVLLTKALNNYRKQYGPLRMADKFAKSTQPQPPETAPE